MTDLLDEIIASAVDDSTSLTVLLRKCLLLAHTIKHDAMKAWANQELNGYSSREELPSYRVMRVGAKGYLSGSFGASMQNLPIPPAILSEKHRHFAESVFLTQALSAYEATAKNENTSMHYEWPADLCLIYQSKILRGFILRTAWQDVSGSSIAEMLDTVRNRTLSMALEIKSNFGSVQDLQDLDPQNVEKLRTTVTNNIFHGPAYFASAGSQISVSETTQANIAIVDRADLDRALRGSGLEEKDLNRLTEALDSDHHTLGSSVSSWVKETAPKVLAGGVKIGGEIAKSLLTDLLKQYLK